MNDSRSAIRLAAGWFLVVLMVAAALAQWILPNRYWIVSPGVAIPLDSMVSVEGYAFRSEGSFLMSAVSTRPATLIGTVFALIDQDSVLVPASVPYGQISDMYERTMQALMKESQLIAAAVALRHGGYPVTIEGTVRVVTILESSPAVGLLKEGDLILEVDFVQVSSAESAVRMIRQRSEGADVILTVEREGDRIALTMPTTLIMTSEGQEYPGIGVLIEPIQTYEFPFSVTIDADSIGGSSAGLMFALEIRDRLDEQDLTGGMMVAGTGSIDIAGSVGAVGGVPQKIVAAEKTGADVFLCPIDNLEEALAVSTEMTIVPVRDFANACEWLLTHSGAI